MKKILLAIATMTMATQVFAQDLVINGAEFGIGKFHRIDNKAHPYESNNAWKVFVLPDNQGTKEAFVKKNSETNYTVFFTNLEEFLNRIVDISKKTGKKVSVLNLNAHGLPGGMWFPKDAKTRESMECLSWKQAANNSDQANYSQYYSAVTKEEMTSFNQMSNSSRIPSYECLTGINEWTQIVAKVSDIKNVFADNAQIHMLSCLVGLGTLGDSYTKGIAELLLPKNGSGQVQTSIKFGLGDWSMPEGMGFWGYESDAQLKRDNEIYPVHKRDYEIMQRGNIRVAQVSDSKVFSGLIKDQDYIFLTQDDRSVDYSSSKFQAAKFNLPLPQRVRVPGTNVTLKLK